jgi:hypothetical protein
MLAEVILEALFKVVQAEGLWSEQASRDVVR